MSSTSNTSERHRSRDPANVKNHPVEAARTTVKHAKSGGKNYSETTSGAKVREMKPSAHRSGSGHSTERTSEKPVPLPQDKLIFDPLPAQYLPTTDNNRRLIVIGDVHGMYNALRALLWAADYDQKTDHLVFVGDLVTRGTEDNGSLNVLDYAIAKKASVVRGNHEDMLLNVEVMERNSKWVEDTRDNPNERFIRHGQNLRTPKIHEKMLYKTLEEKALGRLAESGIKLSQKRMRFIKNMPHLLDLGNVGVNNRMVVAHAGVNPYLSLKRQHPTVVMNVKSINSEQKTCSWLGRLDKERDTLLDKEGKKLSNEAKGPLDPWYEEWEQRQEKLNMNERTTIIFGHNAKEGLQTRNYSLGLDTGVHRDYYAKDGKKKTGMGILTALILTATSVNMIQVKKDKSGKWALKS